MSQVLDKRLADTRLFDIDCSALLGANETISSVTSMSVDQGGLVFGTPQVNGSPISYPNGTVAQAGKVVQVQISGGAIPAGSQQLLCNVHALLATNLNPAIDATVQLRLVDTPNI